MLREKIGVVMVGGCEGEEDWRARSKMDGWIKWTNGIR